MPRLPIEPSPSTEPNNDDSDPVVAEYDVYITNDTTQRLLLQYPDRSRTKPFSNQTSQKPTSLRIKPRAGLVELDIPISTTLNYNHLKGYQYHESIRKSRIIQAGGSLGLAGGFNTGPAGRVRAENDDNAEVNLRDIPRDDGTMDIEFGTEPRREALATQTLGGKIQPPTNGSPIYMLGAFRDNQLHLSQLDHMVQLRTQLPHLDAGDENVRSSAARAKANHPNTAPAADRPEPRAVDMKVKSAADPSDFSSDLHASGTRTADLLRRMQEEKWEPYEWVDEVEAASWDNFDGHMFLNDADPPVLKSRMTNNEFLDAISAPRLDPMRPGGKGLMGRVKPRDRRKRTRKSANKGTVRGGKEVEARGEEEMTVEDGESASGSSDADDGEDEDTKTVVQEPVVVAPASTHKAIPKPRGRPRKSLTHTGKDASAS